MISSGLIYTNGIHILLGHVTGQNFWDIPKGKVEPGETHLQACIRESYEESSLIVDPMNLIDLGVLKYTLKKRLHLYKWVAESLIPLGALKCNATFKDGHKVRYEFDMFKYVNISELDLYVTKNMYKTLTGVLYGI